MLPTTLIQLLATLRALQWHAWVVHWKSAGPNSYSDHLLFQRIYTGDGGGPKIEDQIDGLGERMIANFGEAVINPGAVQKLAMQYQTAVPEGIPGALVLEQQALALAAKAADLLAKGPPAHRISLDNFVRELADARSTAVYLLQQRLGGKKMERAYGALDTLKSRVGPNEILFLGLTVGILYAFFDLKRHSHL